MFHTSSSNSLPQLLRKKVVKFLINFFKLEAITLIMITQLYMKNMQHHFLSKLFFLLKFMVYVNWFKIKKSIFRNIISLKIYLWHSKKGSNIQINISVSKKPILDINYTEGNTLLVWLLFFFFVAMKKLSARKVYKWILRYYCKRFIWLLCINICHSDV